MQRKQRVMVKEFGSALAVLAIYLLTLLVPLHQASATQTNLARLGYDDLVSFSVCISSSDDEDADVDVSFSCPLVGLAKALGGTEPSVSFAGFSPTDLVFLWAVAEVSVAKRAFSPSSPRAPPTGI